MFVNSIKQCFISGASPGISVSMPNTAVATGVSNVSVNLPSPQTFNFGMLRIKSFTPATGPTLSVTGIFASDGNVSNITQIYGGDAAASKFPLDRTYSPMITDLKANQVIIAVNASLASNCDIEFAGV